MTTEPSGQTMPLTALQQRERLETIGQALFGQQWQCALAREIDVDDRLVRRWFTGERAVPEERWRQVSSLARRRAKLLLEAADMVEKGHPTLREEGKRHGREQTS